YLTWDLLREPVAHLHAHFAHAPALTAMLTHRMTGIPHTFTAHARDIYVETPPELLRAQAERAQAVITCTEYNRQHLARPIGQALEAQVMELGLRDRVELLGTHTHDRVRHAYQRASVFALPCVIMADGDRDGIPNVLLEAMASGVPVVSTPVSGIPELIESERDGLLVPPGNPPLLADALDRLLTEPEAGERLARAARAKVEARFARDASAAQLLALFQRGGTRCAPASRSGDDSPDWHLGSGPAPAGGHVGARSRVRGAAE